MKETFKNSFAMHHSAFVEVNDNTGNNGGEHEAATLGFMECPHDMRNT